MNERIKALVKQAYGEVPHERDWDATTLVFDEEKFAKLIILVCERVAKDPRWYDESPSCGWRNPIRHVCYAFKDHFGVTDEK